MNRLIALVTLLACIVQVVAKDPMRRTAGGIQFIERPEVKKSFLSELYDRFVPPSPQTEAEAKPRPRQFMMAMDHQKPEFEVKSFGQQILRNEDGDVYDDIYA